MRTAPIAIGVFVLAGLNSGAAYALQRGHQSTTPHDTPHTTTSTHTAPTPATHGRQTTATTTTTSASAPTATNPIATKINRNPQLASRLTRMLPQGMTIATASNGFKNQGQFIAALHVSRNQQIPFADLKAAMTGPNAVSLGQAIHTLRPSANAPDAVRRANTQTQTDLR